MADISKIKLPNGSEYNLKDSGAIHKSGDETAAGNKTFSGTTTLSPLSKVSIPSNTVIDGSDPTTILSSPVPKYLWHDLFAFCRVSTPSYYTSINNTDWVEATPEYNLFIQKEHWGRTEIISKTGKTGSRWVWNSSGFAWASAKWLIIGGAFADPVATTTVTFEGSTDNSTWTTYFTKTWTFNAVPVWLYINNYSNPSYLRLTITKDPTDTTHYKNIVSIKLLSYRWGDQGQGSELEKPYDWDSNANIYPLANNAKNLGSTSKYWANGYFTNINGVAVGSSPKFTDTTYSVATTSANGLMSSGDKTKLNGISSSYDSATETLTINL